MLPKFSMAASRLTMTFLRAMRTAPLARVTETIMGSNSGVSPTASATENRKDSRGSRRRRALTRNTKSTRKITTWRMRKPNPRVPRSNSVSGGCPVRVAAMRPNSVDAPVRMTTAAPNPLTTEVPRNTAVRASPSPPAGAPSDWACFSRGRDSPVSAASLRKRSLADRSRASAGTRSPAESWITSPGTTSRAGSWRGAPSRRTEAVCPTCSLSRRAAR